MKIYPILVIAITFAQKEIGDIINGCPVNAKNIGRMKKSIYLTIIATYICSAMFAGTFVADNGVNHSTDDLRKLVFTNGKVDTYFTDGSMTSYEFSSLQRLYFTETPDKGDATIAEEVTNESLLLYPNPASDFINLSDVPTDADITVFNMSGIALLNMKADGNELSINVANYKSGIYFMKINSEVVKFIKK